MWARETNGSTEIRQRLCRRHERYNRLTERGKENIENNRRIKECIKQDKQRRKKKIQGRKKDKKEQK